jgi:hypothetical protein
MPKIKVFETSSYYDNSDDVVWSLYSTGSWETVSEEDLDLLKSYSLETRYDQVRFVVVEEKTVEQIRPKKLAEYLEKYEKKRSEKLKSEALRLKKEEKRKASLIKNELEKKRKKLEQLKKELGEE